MKIVNCNTVYLRTSYNDTSRKYSDESISHLTTLMVLIRYRVVMAYFNPYHKPYAVNIILVGFHVFIKLRIIDL